MAAVSQFEPKHDPKHKPKYEEKHQANEQSPSESITGKYLFTEACRYKNPMTDKIELTPDNILKEYPQYLPFLATGNFFYINKDGTIADGKCTGTLLDEHTVLSVAHCFSDLIAVTLQLDPEKPDKTGALPILGDKLTFGNWNHILFCPFHSFQWLKSHFGIEFDKPSPQHLQWCYPVYAMYVF